MEWQLRVHGNVSITFRWVPYVSCADDTDVSSIFSQQGHRDEVITMVANPEVDQVISAGLGELMFSAQQSVSRTPVCKRRLALTRASVKRTRS